MKSNSREIEVWQEGFLDIHHINTGRGEAAFCVFPDGTTLLIDAGDMDPLGDRIGTTRNAKIHPDSSKTPPEWIVNYIRHFFPSNLEPKLDYLLVTHYHGDHFGELSKASPDSQKGGKYMLTGVTAVGDLIPIRYLIDRGFSYPVNYRSDSVADFLQSNPGSKRWYRTLQNYWSFIDHHAPKMKNFPLEAGSRDQIRMQYQPEKYHGFHVRNVKSNHLIWTGRGTETYNHFPDPKSLSWSDLPGENPLSNVILINYGTFSYFNGGDITGVPAGVGFPEWQDVETPVARAVGQVDVVEMNHHGGLDAHNEYFTRTTAAQVYILQSWSSDQPGSNALRRIRSDQMYPGSRDLFATNILPATLDVWGEGFKNQFTGYEGHIVVRVFPDYTFKIFVLDDDSDQYSIEGEYGPYQSE